MSNEGLLGGIDFFFSISIAGSSVLDIHPDKYVCRWRKECNAKCTREFLFNLFIWQEQLLSCPRLSLAMRRRLAGDVEHACVSFGSTTITFTECASTNVALHYLKSYDTQLMSQLCQVAPKTLLISLPCLEASSADASCTLLSTCIIHTKASALSLLVQKATRTFLRVKNFDT